jgi:putative glycosyltransferase (TIGR04372 family)
MPKEGSIRTRQLLDSATEQARKFLRNPSRLIGLPFQFVHTATGKLIAKVRWATAWVTAKGGRAGAGVRRRVFHALLAANPRLADYASAAFGSDFKRTVDLYLFGAGNALLNANKPAEAWKLFSRAVNTNDTYSFFLTAGVCLQHGLGRAREGIALQVRSNALRFAQGSALGFPRNNYLVLDRLWIVNFGHAAQVDYVVKLAALEGRDPKDTILYFPADMTVANRFLVEQWAPHLRMVTTAQDLPFPEKSLEYHALNFFLPDVGRDRPLYLWELAAQTHRLWHAQDRKPLLKLAPDIVTRGWDALAKVGVPGDAWFVSLHVRSPGFHAHHRDLHYVLNSDISDYLPAIREITDRGGWVIRMGDPSMPALPELPNVFDYCHSEIRCDWLDVFLSANCRFFIGTPSGVCYAPQAYGVPCVLANWWPPTQRPWHPGDIFVPKRHRRIGTGQFLSLEESLREPFGYCNSLDHLRKTHRVTVQDCAADDIRGGVIEMMERLDASPRYTDTDLAMRARAEKIYASVAIELYGSTGAFGAGALARDFLRRNPSFLDA